MKTLKKSLALLLLTTAIVSCAKKSNDELIIGTWNCTSAKIDNVEAIGTSIQSLKWTFNENGTGYSVIDLGAEGIDTTNIVYTIDETQLIFTNEASTYNIDKLTETKLEVHGDVQNGTNTTHVEAKFDKM
jgi:hypothetical protein